MKHKKSVLTAVIISGSIGLGVASLSAQAVPGSKQPEQTIPERVQPPAAEGRQQGTPGMSSDNIKKVKEALKARGHDPGTIDGNMDSKTQQALRDFQKANNLPVTGVLDQQTAAKLGVSVSAQGSIQQGQEGSSPQRGQQGSGAERGKEGSTEQPGSAK
jgi:peptidoglycan hydrolase-like protein with peptidoglycan-binding domain